MAVQFLFDPFDADLDQRDEVKVCMEQFGKVLLGIIPVVRDDLCPSYAEYLQLFQRILYCDDVRLVPRLFCNTEATKFTLIETRLN